jgi:hypothetical protein
MPESVSSNAISARTWSNASAILLLLIRYLSLWPRRMFRPSCPNGAGKTSIVG